MHRDFISVDTHPKKKPKFIYLDKTCFTCKHRRHPGGRPYAVCMKFENVNLGHGSSLIDDTRYCDEWEERE